MTRFNRKALLGFFDSRDCPTFSHLDAAQRGSAVSAVTGLIGEDLLIALVLDYWKRSESRTTAEFVQSECRQVAQHGKKKLDAWLKRDCSTIFQVEAKNWSAFSKGGRSVPVDVDDPILRDEAARRWEEYFGTNGQLPAGAEKVMLCMERPQQFLDRTDVSVERLLAFWFPISDSAQQPMSTVSVQGKALHVFSASLYLRRLGEQFVTLQVPRIESRRNVLDQLLPRADGS
jgi:hypothetical protein